MSLTHPILRTQHGLITHQQALDCGLTDGSIRRLLRRGDWLSVRHGVYVEGELWKSLDAFLGRPLLRVRAASLCLRCRSYVFSHDSAALVLGLGLPDPRTALVHVTRPKVHGDAIRAGIKHHLAPYSPDEVVTMNGLRILAPARTALDMAREHGLVAGVACCDAALRAGCTRSDLREARSRMWCWPYSTVMDEAIALADAGAESWLESAGRVLVTGLGHGRPETQFGLSDGSRTVWCDMRVSRHVFEVDGLLKYDEANPSDLPPREVLRQEKLRQDFISGFKLGVSRITAADCGNGRLAAERRLAREVADTNARFGTDISDLAPYIVRRRRH